jgi:hypothetical protein
MEQLKPVAHRGFMRGETGAYIGRFNIYIYAMGPGTEKARTIFLF